VLCEQVTFSGYRLLTCSNRLVTGNRNPFSLANMLVTGNRNLFSLANRLVTSNLNLFKKSNQVANPGLRTSVVKKGGPRWTEVVKF